MIEVRELTIEYGEVIDTINIVNIRVKGPAIAARIFRKKIGRATQEVFCILMLNARHVPIGYVEVSRGTMTQSLVHPREVFRPAIQAGAVALILGHCHPSQNPEPSRHDYGITRRLVKAGHLVGIPIVDHVIVCDLDRYFSMKEDGTYPNLFELNNEEEKENEEQ